ncbi:hypothetical protein V2J09_000520 [Rumex salicifolius]
MVVLSILIIITMLEDFARATSLQSSHIVIIPMELIRYCAI